jgi:hypothetical protein
VVAKNANMPDNGMVGGSKILGKTTTNSTAGEFELAVLMQTQLCLEVVYIQEPYLSSAG